MKGQQVNHVNKYHYALHGAQHDVTLITVGTNKCKIDKKTLQIVIRCDILKSKMMKHASI